MKKILNRVIAFCLVFILAMVPLLSHGGGNGDTKAATAEYEYEISVLPDIAGVTEESGYGVNTKYKIAVSSVESETLYVQTGTSVSLVPDVTYQAGKVNLNGGYIDIEGSIVGYMIVDAGGNLPAYADSCGTDKKVEADKKIGIYAKPELKDMSPSELGNIYYTLVATVEVRELNSDILPDIDWVDDSSRTPTGEYTNGGVKLSGGFASAVQVIDGNKTKSPYSVLYGYVSKAAGQTASINEVTSWYEDADVISAAKLADGASDRKLTAFVTFGKMESNGQYTLASDAVKSAEVTQTSDSTPPDLNRAMLVVEKWNQQDSKWVWDNGISDNAPLYADTAPVSGTTPRYRFALKALWDDGVGVAEDGVTLIIGSDSYVMEKGTQDQTYGWFEYCKEVDALPDTLTSVSIRAEDKAGNNEERVYGKVVGVDRSFKVESKITSDAEGKNAADLPTEYTKDKYYLVITASSGYSFKTVKAEYEQDGNVEELWSRVPASIEQDPNTGLYQFKEIIELPPDRFLTDGKGNVTLSGIQINIEDNGNGSYSETIEGTLFFDNVPPDVGDAELLEDADGTDSWNAVDESGIGDGAYSVDVESDAQYKYSFTVSDVGGSGIDTVSCYTDENCNNPYTNGQITQEQNTSRYYCTVDKADIPDKKNETLKLWIKVVDKAGNVTIEQLKPVLKKTDMEIAFGKIVLKNASGDEIKWSEAENWDVKINKAYTLYVEVSSGYAIDGSTIGIREPADADDAYITGSIQDGTNEQNPKTKRYEATLVFKLPNDENFNEMYSDMTVHVEDTRPEAAGDKTAEIKLGKLVYDNTKPVIEVSVPEGWVKEYLLPYKIQSGTQTIETGLVGASYAIDSEEPVVIQIDGQSEISDMLRIPESRTMEGTMITFSACDGAGNTLSEPNQFIVHVDQTAPSIDRLSIEGADPSVPLNGVPTISADVSDNLTLKEIWMDIKYPDGRTRTKPVAYTYDGIENNIKKSMNYTLETDADGNAADGVYVVTMHAKDQAGNEAGEKSITFTVDNTKPVVSAEIISGMAGGKSPRPDGTDMYYQSDVGVRLSCRDENIAGIYVTDNGYDVNGSVEWQGGVGNLVLSAEGRHVVRIQAYDRAGNISDEKLVEFIIDKSVPVLSLSLNGMPYTEAQGMLYLGGDAAVGVTVADMTVDAGGLNYQVIQTRPDMPTTTSAYLGTAGSLSFYEEAEYVLNFFAVDMANNQGATRTVRFRIDRTAPELSISGISGNGTSSETATVRCSMREAFWRDAQGTVTIYRRAGDGSSETLYKTIDITPTAYETVVSETLTETGEYRIEFEASDRIGHRATTNRTFILDREAPTITLTGVRNYDITDQSVEFHSEISDEFYTSKSVTIEGTRTDINGKANKLTFAAFNQRGNPTIIDETFSEDGIYDITVTSTDAAGNVRSTSVHFTVDKTKPEIGSLEQFDGAVLTSFDWDIDLDDLVSDLTVCDIHMYLNGSEYDGVSEIEDGSYTLLITAEDELGHYSEASVSFVLDTKAPVFITTGVEDGEAKEEAYSIDISLQLEEDMLTLVTLNDKIVTISNNTAHIDVTTEGSYTLYMKAIDEAGNEAEKTIHFRFGSEVNIWLWIIIIVCALLAAGIILLIVLKKKKNS